MICHPFIKKLQALSEPHGDFVTNILRLYENKFGDSPEHEALVLQEIIYSCSIVKGYQPSSESDKTCYQELQEAYISQIELIPTTDTLTLALHRIFLEKIKLLNLHKTALTVWILRVCWKLTEALLNKKSPKELLSFYIDEYGSKTKEHSETNPNFLEFLKQIQAENVAYITEYAKGKILNPLSPLAVECFLSSSSDFIRTLIRNFYDSLNQAEASEDPLRLAEVLQSILNSCLSGTLSRPTRSIDDQRIFVMLSQKYHQLIDEMKKAPELTPEQSSCLLIHLYFSHKLLQQQRHPSPQLATKLSFATQLQRFATERLKTGASPANSFATIMSGIESHRLRQGLPEGQLEIIAQRVQTNTVSQADLPTLGNQITSFNSSHVRLCLSQAAQNLGKWDYFNKRWLAQLSDPTHEAGYYQTWINQNPYQHASQMAITGCMKYTLAMTGLAVVATLIVSAATGGIGGLLALNTATSFVETMPGLYVLGIAGTAVLSAPLSYVYNKKECLYKQTTIENCIRAVPSVN